MLNPKIIIGLGALAGCLAVALGAFGAHAFKSYLTQIGRLDTYETATQYLFYHSLALIVTGLLAERFVDSGLSWSAYFFLAGLLFFCGSLYAICAGGSVKWGMVAPIGGLSFIIGWALLALKFFKIA